MNVNTLNRRCFPGLLVVLLGLFPTPCFSQTSCSGPGERFEGIILGLESADISDQWEGYPEYTYQGLWNTATSYEEGASVIHNGAFWRATTANQSQQPTLISTDWIPIDPKLYQKEEARISYAYVRVQHDLTLGTLPLEDMQSDYLKATTMDHTGSETSLCSGEGFRFYSLGFFFARRDWTFNEDCATYDWTEPNFQGGPEAGTENLVEGENPLELVFADFQHEVEATIESPVFRKEIITGNRLQKPFTEEVMVNPPTNGDGWPMDGSEPYPFYYESDQTQVKTWNLLDEVLPTESVAAWIKDQGIDTLSWQKSASMTAEFGVWNADFTVTATLVRFRVAFPCLPEQSTVEFEYKSWPVGGTEANAVTEREVRAVSELEKAELPFGGWEISSVMVPKYGYIKKLVAVSLHTPCSDSGDIAGVTHQAEPGSPSWSLSLGKRTGGGSAGTLEFSSADLTSLDACMFRASAAIEDEVQQVSDANRRIQQILAPQVLVDLETVSEEELVIRVYPSGGVERETSPITEDGVGSRPQITLDLPTPRFETADPPLSTWRVKLATTGPHELHIYREGGGGGSDYRYTQPGTGEWVLNQGNGESRIAEVQTTLPDQTIQTVQQILASDATVVQKVVQVEKAYSFGQRKISEVRDPDGENQVETWDYYEDVIADGGAYGQLKSFSSSSGDWSRFEYDGDGRMTKEVKAWLNQAPGAAETVSRVRSITYEPDGLTALISEKVLGQEVSRRVHVQSADGTSVSTFECVAPGATQQTAGTLETIRQYETVAPFVGRLKDVESPDGRKVSRAYSVDPETGVYTTTTTSGLVDSGGVFLSGTVAVIQTDSLGNLISSILTDVNSGIVLEEKTVLDSDAWGRPLLVAYHDGTSEQRTYSCCGLATYTDRDGTVTSYTYSSLGLRETMSENGITTQWAHTPAGNVNTIHRKGTDNSLQLMESRTYSLSGRLESVTDGAGHITQYAWSRSPDGGTLLTTTYPDLSTEVQERFRDGQVRQVTGNGARPVKMERIPASGETSVKEIRVGDQGEETEWVRTVSDMLGRIKRIEYPDGSATTRYYDETTGMLKREEDPDGVTRMWNSTPDGETVIEAVDLNNNDEIDAVDYQLRTQESFLQEEGRDLRIVTRSIWTGSEFRLLSTAKESVDGLWASVQEEGRITRRATVRDGSGGWTTTLTLPDNSQEVRTVTNGRVSQRTSPSGSYSYAYDPHGRLHTRTDTRTSTVTTWTYHPGDLSASISRGGYLTQYNSVDHLGAPLLMTLPGGATITRTYSPFGQVLTRSGSGTTPLTQTYDGQGRLKTHITSSGTTTWTYHPARGTLKKKTDSAGRDTDFTFTAAGRLHTRTNARSQVTTLFYDAFGLVETVSTSDDTPTISYVRDLQGRLDTITDSLGTRAFTYTPDQDTLERESFTLGELQGIEQVYSYDALDRKDGHTLKRDTTTLWSESRTYDAASRLQSVTAGTSVFGYTRTPGTDMVEELTRDRGGVEAVKTVFTPDALNRLESLTHTPAVGSPQSRTYGFDAAGRRERSTDQAGSYWAYTYSDRNEVLTAGSFLSDDTPVPGLAFSYGYDEAGNRDEATLNGRFAATSYTDTNGVDTRGVVGSADVLGTADALAAVTVNGVTAARLGDRFTSVVSADTSTGPAYVDVTIQSELDQVVTEATGKVYLPQSSTAFVYDDDGNLTLDSRWSYAWNALGQLTSMTTRPEAVTAGVPNLRLSFTYDYAGRRATKTVEQHVYGNWRELHRRQFVYSGRNLTAELLSDGRMLRSYVWGEGQGDGIGALLEIHDHLEQNTFYPAYDGNGNVISLTDADTKTIVATYTYGPYGQLLESTGAYARINPFRFSTRYTDNESGLLVYTHRYYDPETGRWLSRDPLGEVADDNLYRFAGNNPVDQVDLQGLLRYWHWEPITKEEHNRGVFRTRHQPYGLADIGQDRYFSYNPYNPNLPNIMRDAADAGTRRALRELSQEYGVLLELDTYKLMAGEFSRAPFSFAVCMVSGAIEQAVETGKHWLDYTQYLKEGDLVSAQYTANYLATKSAPEIIAMAVTSGASNMRRAAPSNADEFVDVYRVFGDDARAQGFSWTTTDPRTVRNFRDRAGLPSGGESGANNSAEFLIQGRARVDDVIKFKSADPLDGNAGGLPELIIDPKNVDLNDFSVLKP